MGYLKEYIGVKLVVLFVLGICLAYALLGCDISVNVPIINWLIGAAIIVLILIASPIEFRPILLIVSLGFARYLLVLPQVDDLHFLHFIDDTTAYKGIVTTEIKHGKTIKFEFAVDSIIKKENTIQKSTGRLLVYVEEDSLSRLISPGDELILYARVQLIKAPTNPSAFDFKTFMAFKGIHHQMYVKTHAWTKTSSSNLKPVLQLASNLRKKGLQILKKHITNQDNRAIASAMLLGYRHEINKSLYKTYAETGAIHVLAVSGLHVGILQLILLFVFRFIPPRNIALKVTKSVLILSVIWLFALITGAAPAVMRAATMFSLFTLGVIFYTRLNAFNILGSSALLLLLINPLLLFQVGFQLSYLALFSILYFQPKIKRWLSFKSKLPNTLWDLINVSISAQIMVFPLTIFYFHKFPVYFWLSGMIAVTLAFIVLALGLSLFASSFFSSFLAEMLGVALDFCLSLFVTSIKWVYSLPYHIIDNIWLEPRDILIIYGSLICLTLWFKLKRTRLLFISLFGIIGLQVSLSLQQNRISDNKSLVVYDTKSGLCLDIFKSGRCYNFTEDGLPSSEISYATAMNRMRLSSGAPDLLLDSLNQGIEGGNILFDLDNKRILIFNGIPMNIEQMAPIDILIINKFDSRALSTTDIPIGHKIILTKGMKYSDRKVIVKHLNQQTREYQYVGDGAAIIDL